jgi:phosphatidylinositol glycan class O
MNSKLKGLLTPILALCGLYWFAASFFLAKRSLPHTSNCDEANLLLRETLGLSASDVVGIQSVLSTNNGCWMDRRVDSLVILVVDALRFDFARHHLPFSVGARLANQTSSSQLLQFVADPPTVTMQRLKGLTTGGLPTFADISASFGGATVDEDSWVQQLVDTLPTKRGFNTSRMAFVGDDTWIDLFPTQFDDAHPFPSFNTRDLDTVDNGCLEHLPRLLQHLRRRGVEADGFEVIVAHFLGVDHVGHTYGPHNKHMDAKLRQMDAALSTVLDLLDESNDCHAAMIFGDHGMTEEGNHGGGTQDEVNAALFVHFSRGCGDRQVDITGVEVGADSERAFQSIHQIDLVPTISMLLGLPIPYANIGGLVPSLLPPPSRAGTVATPFTAAALALNAAQVWRYFTVYSSTANKLPSLPELQSLLDDAVSSYQSALAPPDGEDAMAYRVACGKFKLFLSEASELGHRVWTRFDTVGMIMGGGILCVALIFAVPLWYRDRSKAGAARSLNDQYLELGTTAVLLTFQCVLLTFSNSYIDAEQAVVMFSFGVICVAIALRSSSTSGMWWAPLLLVLLSRLSELSVSGHGLDPSIPLHLAHNSFTFLSALSCLALLRYHAFQAELACSFLHFCLDMAALLCLAISWWEKRSNDTTRNGYISCRLALILAGIGAVLAAKVLSDRRRQAKRDPWLIDLSITILSKLFICMMAVTGPSMSSSVLLFVLQSLLLYNLSRPAGRKEVGCLLVAPFAWMGSLYGLHKHPSSLPPPTTDICTRFGCNVAIDDQTRVLCHQPRMCL